MTVDLSMDVEAVRPVPRNRARTDQAKRHLGSADLGEFVELAMGTTVSVVSDHRGAVSSSAPRRGCPRRAYGTARTAMPSIRVCGPHVSGLTEMRRHVESVEFPVLFAVPAGRRWSVDPRVAADPGAEFFERLRGSTAGRFRCEQGQRRASSSEDASNSMSTDCSVRSAGRVDTPKTSAIRRPSPSGGAETSASTTVQKLSRDPICARTGPAQSGHAYPYRSSASTSNTASRYPGPTAEAGPPWPGQRDPDR